MLLRGWHCCRHARNLRLDAMEIIHADSFVAKEVMQRIQSHKLLPQTCIMWVLTTLVLKRLYQELNVTLDGSDLMVRRLRRRTIWVVLLKRSRLSKCAVSWQFKDISTMKEIFTCWFPGIAKGC